MSRRARLWPLFVTLLSALALSLGVGTSQLGLIDLYRGIESGDPDAGVVLSLRTARTAAAIAAGAALAVSGVLLQSITRNRLADPGLLGINATAGLAVLTGFVLLGRQGPLVTTLLSAVGAALGAALVMAVQARRRGDAVTVTLAGIALAAVVTAGSNLLLLASPATMSAYRAWSLGDLQGLGQDELIAGAALIGGGLVLTATLLRGLEVHMLGTTAARSLGLRPTSFTAALALALSLMAGGAAALVGPLVFVGLASPNVARELVGAELRRLVPAAAAIGATLTIVADVLARVMRAPAEVPLGVVVVFIGAPVLLWVLRRPLVMT